MKKNILIFFISFVIQYLIFSLSLNLINKNYFKNKIEKKFYLKNEKKINNLIKNDDSKINNIKNKMILSNEIIKNNNLINNNNNKINNNILLEEKKNKNYRELIIELNYAILNLGIYFSNYSYSYYINTIPSYICGINNLINIYNWIFE